MGSSPQTVQGCPCDFGLKKLGLRFRVEGLRFKLWPTGLDKAFVCFPKPSQFIILGLDV